MSREIRNLSKQDVITLAKRTHLEIQGLHYACQAVFRVERDMRISGSGVPPVETLAIDIVGLYEGRKENQARVRQEGVHVGENASRFGRMFDDLEADDTIEPAGGTRGVPLDKRVKGLDVWKSGGAQRFGQDAIAPAVVEH